MIITELCKKFTAASTDYSVPFFQLLDNLESAKFKDRLQEKMFS